MNARLPGKLTFWKVLFAVILAVGAYATFIRFARGLGASTNLSDEFPWGLWIGFDVLVGVGLAAGGFVIAATVHIFRMERYEEIARPTILTAFLGYLLVCVALAFDLGHPYRIWHPIVMWNPHSVMFEVGWCVTLYTTVLALEFSPLVLERFGLKAPLAFIRRIYIFLVIAGVLLSTLHQSSLGTLYVIVPDKLHGLWYSPLLPVFFFISAIAAGLAMTIFESFLSYRAFGKRIEAELLQGLARVIVVVLAVYAVFRVQDLASRGNLAKAFVPSPESILFWGEALLGVVLPAVLFAIPRVRRNETGLFFAAVLTVLGFIVNRLNVAVTGMAASSGVAYVPSVLEFAVTVTVVAVGFFAFAMAVKYLPIFPDAGVQPQAAAASTLVARARPAFNAGALAGLWVLLLVGIVAVGYTYEPPKNALASTPTLDGDLKPHAVPADLRLPGPYRFAKGESSPGQVIFDHATHVSADDRCDTCHAKLFRINEPGKPLSGSFSQERIHEGDLCRGCHDGKQAFDLQQDCSACHRD